MNKVMKVSLPVKNVLLELKSGEQLYKWTGKLPPIVKYNKSGKRVSLATFNILLAKNLIKVYDAAAFETWYDLSKLGKSIEL